MNILTLPHWWWWWWSHMRDMFCFVTWTRPGTEPLCPEHSSDPTENRAASLYIQNPSLVFVLNLQVSPPFPLTLGAQGLDTLTVVWHSALYMALFSDPDRVLVLVAASHGPHGPNLYLQSPGRNGQQWNRQSLMQFVELRPSRVRVVTVNK